MTGRRFFTGLTIAFWVFASQIYAEPADGNTQWTIRIGVYEDHLDDIRRIETDTPMGCPLYEDAAATFDQVVMEYTFLCHIIAESGVDMHVKLIPFPIQDRVLQSLANGKLEMSGFGIWEKDASGSEFLLSDPLLEKGEFSKGLYTSKARQAELAYPSRETLGTLVGVINRNWDIDWDALKCGNIRRLHVDSYEHMFKLVALQRADVVPVTFSSEPDMAKHEFGVSLYPVQGIKILFPESTHFVLSSHWKHAVEMQTILKTGIDKLRSSGVLKRQYQDVGLLNPQTESWQPLCLHMNP